MVLPLALGLMAYGGYRKYKADEQDANRQTEIDAEAKDEREFRKEERARVRMGRKAVTDAAAPRAVEDGTTFQPENDDDGNPMPANPTAGTFKVDGTRYTDRGAADKAATEANAPKARTARMSAALESAGEIDKAASVRTSARQEEVADLQLDEVKRRRLDEAYDRDLSRYRTHDDLSRFVSESAGDGQGGAVKVKAVPNPDGKSVTYHQVNPDGSTTATPYTFSNDFNGVAQAAFMLSKGVGAKDKLDHLIGTAKTAEDRARWEKEFGLREQDAKTRAGREERVARAAERSAAATERAANARMAPAPTTARTPDSTFDAKTAAEIAKDQVQKEADEARANGKPWTGDQLARRNDEIVQSLRSAHTSRFIEETVQSQLAAVQGDPVQYAAAYAKVTKLGMPAQRLAQMGFKPPAGMQQPAVSVPGASQRMAPPPLYGASQGAPAAAAPAAGNAGQPAAPVQGLEAFTAFVAQNIAQPNGKAAIAQVARTRLPAIQSELAQHSQVMAMPLVSGPVKAKLKAKMDELSQEAQMMQTFLDGNPGTF